MLSQKRNNPRQGNQADQQRKNREKKEIGKLRGPAGDVVLIQGPADSLPQNPPRSANPGGHHASVLYSLAFRPPGCSTAIPFRRSAFPSLEARVSPFALSVRSSRRSAASPARVAGASEASAASAPRSS